MAFFTVARVSGVVDRRPEGASAGDETRVESIARIDEEQHSRVWDGGAKRVTCCWCDAMLNERLRASALGEQEQGQEEHCRMHCGSAACAARRMRTATQARMHNGE